MTENNKVKIGVVEAEVLKVGAVIKWSYEPEYDIEFMQHFAKLASKHPHIIEVDEFTWVLTDNKELEELIDIECDSICVTDKEKLDDDEYELDCYKNYKFYILEAEEIIKN